ncbi:MAG: NAD(P)-dependent oxidoreductase [Firmicutes bacterium]|nr:NAD(P)-dependent oxidoreductase [Bacillota bacterium]NBI64442.1 NAD(P)-dependent oxidoreductase [Clostridiales bacterium]
MDIILIGGTSKMMNTLIDKFNKSGHRIFLLTGHREKRMSYKHVFEKYNFSYEDDSIHEILKSIKPQITIFMGSYDSNFDWSKAQQESMRYTAGLMNILSACSLIESGRFVYLSSQEVYGNSYINNVPETENVSPKGLKALTIAQGESLCDNYRKAQGLDTLILRFDGIYSVPKRGERQEDTCFKMCMEAIKHNSISASKRNMFSMLYLNDAVELAYKVIIDKEAKQFLYHISSMEEITEMQLAEAIRQNMGSSVEIIDNSVGENRRLVLDGQIYQKEYDQKIFTNYQDGVKKVVDYVKRHSGSFAKEGSVGIGWFGKLKQNISSIFGRLVPFIENMICFLPFFMLNNRAVGSEYFDRVDFYLLYVLLFAIVHGQQQAVFSGLLSVAGYCFRQMYTRSGFDVLLDHNTYVWMAQLFILGMIVGYMRDQLRHIRTDNEEELQYLQGKLEDISDINDSNVRMKQNFEMQVVNQKDSLGKIYDITSSLDRYGPEETLFYAAQVLAKLMDSRDVAIYVVANQNYARLFSATSPEARKLGNSIEYTAMKEMFEELKEDRVYINKNMNDKLPLMASAVFEEGRMQLILMVWGIPWQRMTLAESNRLTIIGRLIQNAVLRANRYLDTLKDQRYMKGTNMLAQDAFTLLVKAFFDARDKGLTECALLRILTKDDSPAHAAAVLSRNMRQTDYMGMLKDGGLYVLLSNTDEEHVGGVIERFQSFGYASQLRKGLDI